MTTTTMTAKPGPRELSLAEMQQAAGGQLVSTVKIKVFQCPSNPRV